MRVGEARVPFSLLGALCVFVVKAIVVVVLVCSQREATSRFRLHSICWLGNQQKRSRFLPRRRRAVGVCWSADRLSKHRPVGMMTVIRPTLLLIANHPQFTYLIKRYSERSGCQVISTSTV